MYADLIDVDVTQGDAPAEQKQYQKNLNKYLLLIQNTCECMNERAYNALINMYLRLGNIAEAHGMSIPRCIA